MTRHETPFATHAELIIVEAMVAGRRLAVTARLVLDTGAAYTTITPELASSVGYGVRDGIRRTRVRTAVGDEEGYVLAVEELRSLGIAMSRFPVHVFDLGHDDIDGLVGLNFLSELNYEIRSSEHRILVERARRAS